MNRFWRTRLGRRPGACGATIWRLLAAVLTFSSALAVGPAFPQHAPAQSDAPRGKAKRDAEDSAKAAARPATKAASKPRRSAAAAPTVEAENAVLAFVAEHHAELGELLARLKANDPGEYAKAMRDLRRVRDRLAAARDRDPERYELDLRVWKLQSRAQLLAARLTMNSDEAQRAELKQVLTEHQAAQMALFQRDRQRLHERLAKLDEQIARLEDGGEQLIENQIRQMTSGKAAAPRPPRKNSRSPGANIAAP